MRISSRNLERIKRILDRQFPQKEKRKINIYFENNFEDWICLMLGKFIVAKGVQEKTGGRVYSIRAKFDDSYKGLCDSFGYSPLFWGNNVSRWDKVKSYLYAVLFCAFKNNGSNIIKLHYKKVHIGDLIYDYIIRTCKERIYTIDKIKTKEQFMLLSEGYLYAVYFDKLFKRCKPHYYIAGDIIYLNGIIVRTALKYGSKIIEFSTGKYAKELQQRELKDYEPNYHRCHTERVDEYRKKHLQSYWKEKVDKDLEVLFSGIGDWNTKEAYYNKKILTKEEIENELGISNHKKNIVIMAHCFSDSPHNGGRFIYNDYFQWLEETLKIVKNLDNVNWILKPHPCRKFYGEKGIVEELYHKYRSANLHWLPDEYSSKMVPLIADAIVTVSGTGGIEYSCCGVPCVTVGKPFYGYYDFTINIKSIEHYKKVLGKLHLVRRLNGKQINKAKEIFYAYNQIIEFSDDSLQQLLNKFYYDSRNSNHENSHLFIKELLEWGESNLIKDSELYKQGYSIS